MTRLLRTVALSLAFATPALAQAPAAPSAPTVKEDKPGLLKRAKVTPAAAMAAAQAKVPGGTIRQAEIEEEKGKLVYSFDIVSKGKSGTDEVNVDAMTGAVVSVQHESPEQEAKEKAADAAKAKGAKAPPAGKKP
ncbi:MAG: PepSY domain-containing protein [Gemmatimonadetes bacterium]|nr:PepSY domain-containing protein [Gemmatimonadota bacterium]